MKQLMNQPQKAKIKISPLSEKRNKFSSHPFIFEKKTFSIGKFEAFSPRILMGRKKIRVEFK